MAAGRVVAERFAFQFELPSFVTRDGPAMAFIVAVNTIARLASTAAAATTFEPLPH